MPTVLRRPPVTGLRLLLAASVVGGALSSCSSDGRTLRPAQPAQTQSIVDTTTTITVTRPKGLTATVDWSSDGATIDAGYTCDGEDRQPRVVWTGVPSDGVEVAISMIDDDIGFVHWIVGGLPAVDGALQSSALPVGAVAGANDFGVDRWKGPCPPPGQPHHYRVTVYVLSEEFGLGDNLNGKNAVAALRDRTIATAQVQATYKRRAT